jgi:hypothetical protein
MNGTCAGHLPLLGSKEWEHNTGTINSCTRGCYCNDLKSLLFCRGKRAYVLQVLLISESKTIVLILELTVRITLFFDRINVK